MEKLNIDDDIGLGYCVMVYRNEKLYIACLERFEIDLEEYAEITVYSFDTNLTWTLLREDELDTEDVVVMFGHDMAYVSDSGVHIYSVEENQWNPSALKLPVGNEWLKGYKLMSPILPDVTVAVPLPPYVNHKYKSS